MFENYHSFWVLSDLLEYNILNVVQCVSGRSHEENWSRLHTMVHDDTLIISLTKILQYNLYIPLTFSTGGTCHWMIFSDYSQQYVAAYVSTVQRLRPLTCWGVHVSFQVLTSLQNMLKGPQRPGFLSRPYSDSSLYVMPMSTCQHHTHLMHDHTMQGHSSPTPLGMKIFYNT